MFRCERCGVFTSQGHLCTPVYRGGVLTFVITTAASTTDGAPPRNVPDPVQVARWDQMRERWREDNDR